MNTGVRYLSRCLLLLILAGPARAGETIRYAGELNHIPQECRAVAMGNTAVVLPGRASTAFWNPSATACAAGYQAWIEGARLYGGLSHAGSLALSAPVQNALTIGTLYSAFFPGDIVQYDSLAGTPLQRLYNPRLRGDAMKSKGVFHNNHHLVILSLAKDFPIEIPRPSGFSVPVPVSIAGGLNFKYYWQTMTPDDDVRMGMNVNVDMGILLRIGVDYDLSSRSVTRELLFGIAARNILPTRMMWLYSYDSYTEPIDRSALYGISYTDKTGLLRGNWTITAALKRYYSSTVHLGLEYEFLDMVALRAGLSGETPSLGAGIRYKRFTLDYAFTFDELDYSPVRLSFGVAF